MLLVTLAETSAAVAATTSRTSKGELLATTIAALSPEEIVPGVGFLVGRLRQGSIGIGWATVAGLDLAPATEPTLTVADLDQLLSAVAATTGPGSVGARARLLTATLGRATRVELDFVRRLLVGDLRQGALAGVVTDAVARAAAVRPAELRRAVMLRGDLAETAAVALTTGADGLAAIDLEVGRPIQPMLASSSPDVASAVEALGLVQVDWKLDGARIQLHVDDGRVGIYTRNLNDVTARLGHIAAAARHLPCRSAVLDGEVLGFFGEERTPQPFQDTMSVFGTEGGADGSGLEPFFFDLMFLDGRSLIDEALSARSVALEGLVGDRVVPRITTDDPDVAAAHLDGALAAGHEGVMVKAVDGRYEAGRRGRSWRKVKPVHTLDLVVLAAEWGSGRRRGWLSNLHLGARDAATGELVMVGKTFKGLTDELLAWQTDQFLARKAGERDGGRTVVIEPGLVVEIALDGAQTSTRYPGGVALRFARVKGYRPDRSPADADTIDAVRALL
ncbi:MAG: ATP-dependent DNA ligase [Acidimicrobiales bacterium]